MSLRIAHFVHRYPPAIGGAEAYFARLSEHLVATGHRVDVFTTVAKDLEAFWTPRGECFRPGASQQGRVSVHRYALWRCRGRRFLLKPLSLIPLPRWQSMVLPCNPIAWKMWTEAAGLRNRYDVVHASAFPYAWPIVAAFRMARAQRIPFLLTPFLHLGDPDDPGDRTRRAYTAPCLWWLLQAADRIFVQSPSEYKLLVNRGIPAHRIVLQGLGVDVAACTGGTRQRTRAAWGAAEGEPVIGHLANNSAEKGTIDLLNAVSLLWKKGLAFRVVLAGPEMPNFLKFLKRYTVEGPLIRLGVLSDAAKQDFFSGLDLFALPSRSDSFGLVLLEAWANRIPNVAYRSGGIQDLIRDGRDGLLVTPGRIEELAAALETLLKDRERSRRLGDAGFERTASEFQWADRLELVARVYHELRASAAKPGRSPVCCNSSNITC